MKWQKPISLFLAFFFLFSNLGVAMNVHYCGDEIASVSLRSSIEPTASEKDCCGIFEQKSHCCKDKVFHFEKKTDQATVLAMHALDFEAIPFYLWNPVVLLPLSVRESKLEKKYTFQSNAPPLFVLYSRYIFYERF